MFVPAISTFRDNINALRDFVDVIEPVLHEKTQALVQQREAHLAPLLLMMKNLALPSEPEISQVSDEELRRRCDDLKITVTVSEPSENKRSAEITGEGVPQLTEALRSFIKTLRRMDHLYESSLISLSSMTEWFLASLLQRYFETYPESVGTREKVFSLQDLRQIGSTEDARKGLIDSTVENILHGSFEDWIKFLKEHAKLNMGYLPIGHLIEIFQRRNLLVHNAGTVNSIYMSRVEASLRQGCTIGERITVPRDYLDSAIALVELNFLLIAAELWKKLEPDNQQRSELLLNINFDHLLAGRWKIVEGLCFFVKNDKQALERFQLIAQVNYWQTFKWRDRFEEVRPEIEKADYSAKDPLFRLALGALRDDMDMFFELLPEVVDSNKLSIDDLESWPLFRTIRASERFRIFMEQRRIAPVVATALPENGESAAF